VNQNVSRVVFQLADSVGPENIPYIEITLEEPSVFGSKGRPFVCTGDEPPLIALKNVQLTANAIRQAGQFLYNSVVDAHDEIREYLIVALQTQKPQRYPVFIEIATGSGIEQLPWETLCSPGGKFLGLDERWAFGRIVDGPAKTAASWQFTPPLRIAAILSCLDVPAIDEWRALKKAIRAANLEVEVLAVVSEETLFEHIRGEVAKGTSPAVRVELVPPDLEELQELVKDFRPHILHFFCHGSTEGGPNLSLAVKSDWIIGFAQDSLTVEAEQIRDFTARTDALPWLVVLNCCRSAAADEQANAHADLQSIALKLVSEGALPAVVGMREPVFSDDANLFTRTFYQQLLRDLSTRLVGEIAADDPMDWPRLVVAARTSLARKHKGLTLSKAAMSTMEWTLPVVYVRPTSFIIQPAPPPAAQVEPEPPPPPQPREPQEAPTLRAARLEKDALRRLINLLPSDTPPALRSDIEQRLASLTSQLEHK
jgi:CHAT domain